MNDIKVSIVTVCKNSGRTIEKTIRSVLCQTYKNIEYIIKDGGSEDDTLQICHRFEEEFEKNGMTMKILSSPDGGIYDAMNKGIDVATGDIVGIIPTKKKPCRSWQKPLKGKTMIWPLVISGWCCPPEGPL